MTPSHIQKHIDDGALFVINHSGGKDSQAMYLKLRDMIPRDQILIVHADLGRHEWDDLQGHIRDTVEGHEVHVAHAIYKDGSPKDLVNRTRRRGKFPSPSIRWCTSDLKAGPIDKVTRRYMKEHGFTLAVNCMGIRAQESHRRAKANPYTINKRLTLHKTGARTVWDWLPIFDMSNDEVFETIAAAGQKPHYVYELGMSRLSCCFCIMASKKDLTLAAQLRPGLYKEYVELEKELGFTLQSGKTLEETTGIKAC